MARKKVEIKYISDYVKRKAALKKQTNGLLKKVYEISTLCGIEACAIIYPPNEIVDLEPLGVWPSEEGVRKVISKFRGVSELEQGKKMLCQESLLKENIKKEQGKLMKLRNENRVKEIDLFMSQCLANVGNKNNLENIKTIDLQDITFFLDNKLEDIEKKIKMHQAQDVTPPLAVENNGGEITMTNQGEQAVVNETNNVDVINVGGTSDGMLSLEDVNVESSWLNECIRWKK